MNDYLLLAEAHITDLRREADADRLTREAPDARRARSRGDSRKRAGALGAMVAGLALAATAAVAVATAMPASSQSPEIASAPNADVVHAEPEVNVTDLTYAPGHSSGWHIHSGLHSVVVLSGTLTIFDEGCRRQDYAPGTSYLGGSQPHLARNEAPDELSVVVTSVYQPSPTGHGSSVPAPAGCVTR